MIKPFFDVAVGLVISADSILIAKRPPQVYMPGVWEFPGGKIEAGESPMAALQREYQEEVGIEVLSAEPYLQVEHEYSERRVCLQVWRITDYAGEPKGLEGQELRWVPISDLTQYTFPNANHAIVAALQQD